MKHRHPARLTAYWAGAAAIAAAALLAQPARATPTWRCGSSYTDQPCEGGRAIDASDPRGPAEREAADRSTQDARRDAERMRQDRLRTESLATRSPAVFERPAPTAPGVSTDRGHSKKTKKAGRGRPASRPAPGTDAPFTAASPKDRPRRGRG